MAGFFKRVNYNQKQELEMKKFLRFLKDKSGVTAIEYALKNLWNTMGSKLQAAEAASK